MTAEIHKNYKTVYISWFNRIRIMWPNFDSIKDKQIQIKLNNFTFQEGSLYCIRHKKNLLIDAFSK
jgi:hypothetical protein